MIININENFGDAVKFESVAEMQHALEALGYMPSDGLKEGVDYEVVQE